MSEVRGVNRSGVPWSVGSRLTLAATAALLLVVAPAASASSVGVRAAANGCGGHDTQYIPDGLPRLFNFRSACDRHDDCYATAGRTKEACDSSFHSNMRESCRRRDDKRRVKYKRRERTCYGVAALYYEAVKRSSKARSAYEEAQRQVAQPAPSRPAEPPPVGPVTCGTIVITSEGTLNRVTVTARGVSCDYARAFLLRQKRLGITPRGWRCSAAGVELYCRRGAQGISHGPPFETIGPATRGTR